MARLSKPPLGFETLGVFKSKELVPNRRGIRDFFVVHEYYIGKTVFISGAGSGLGRQLSLDLSDPNINLVLLDINQSSLDETARLCRDKGASSVLVLPACDVSDVDAMCEIPQILTDKFSKIDILICNAGITSSTDVTAFNRERNREIMSVNYFGTVNLCSLFLDQMVKRRSGHIIGISSFAGVRGVTKTACYGASKAAQAMFLESLRTDLIAYKVKVTTMILGFVDTPINDFLRDKYHLPFMLSPSRASCLILKAISKGKGSVAVPFSTKLAVFFAKRLPDFLLDFINRHQPFNKKQQPPNKAS